VNTSDIADDSVTFDKMRIKIDHGKKLEAYNGTTIFHSLGEAPTSVIVTPVYTTSVLDGAYAIYANVHSITSSSFEIGLWYLTFDSPPAIYEINEADPDPFTDGVSVNWITIVE
jgi:hypothetical protein